MDLLKHFKKTDDYDRTTWRWGRIGSATAAAGAIALTTLYNSLYIVEQREAALEVMFGGVNEVNNEPGLYMKWPFLERAIKYPLYRQRAEVSSDQANLRTKDQMRVEGGVFIDYEIDENSATIENIYADLRGDSSDIKDAIEMRAKEAAVIAFGEFSSVDLTTKINEITDRTKEILQASIDEQAWPFRVKDVISDGVRLSPDSEKKLERVMAAEQELTVLSLRERNAGKAQSVLVEEGKALAGLYSELAKGGVPIETIPTLVCLKMANDADKIQVEFAPGCFPGQQGYHVAVNADSVGQRATAPGMTPQ